MSLQVIDIEQLPTQEVEVNKAPPVIKGKDGKSAYEIAVEEGFEGTEAEWLESLKGEKGKDGTYITKISFVGVLDSNGDYQFKMEFSDGTAHYFQVPAIDFAVSALKLVDTENKGLNLGDESTPVYFKDGVPVLATDVSSGDVPIFIDETLVLPTTHEGITIGYANSIDADSLNRIPKAGEKATGFCKTSDNYVFSFVCEFTGESVESGTFYPFVFTEVVLLHEGIEYAKQEDIPTQVSQLDNDAGYQTEEQVDAKIDALEETVVNQPPMHIFTPHKPQTFIVNSCQADSAYNGNGLTVNTTDHILGTQCVNVTGYIAFLHQPVDVVHNHLVLKIKVNSLDNGNIFVKLRNTSNTANSVNIELFRSDVKAVYGEWREYTVPYKNFVEKIGDVNAIDFTAIDSIIVSVSRGVGDFDIQFMGYRPNTLNRGIVSFTFDDGYKSQAVGIKTLAERGLTGTIFHVVEAPDTTTLTTDELQELVTLYGADIEVHGGYSYAGMTDEELIAHWTSSQKYLRENGISDGRHLAYPNGMHPTRVVNLARKYFDSARTIDRWVRTESFPPYDNYRMRACSAITDADKDIYKTYIDDAIANNTWLILVFHEIEDGHPNEGMYCSPSTLGELADYAIKNGANIMNIAEVFASNGGNNAILNGNGVAY